jgi:processing peptidase subunit alpha
MLRNAAMIAARATSRLSRTSSLESRPLTRVLLTCAPSSRRSYHSYPDPDEKGVETNTIAKNLTDRVMPQILDKQGQDFTLDEKFKISIDGKNAGFPGVPTGKFVQPGNAGPEVQATVLASGLTVASQDKPGLMTSFCFCVGTGSSYETQDGSSRDNTGVTQLLELASFKSTTSSSSGSGSRENLPAGEDALDIATRITQLGGMVQCLAGRENTLYCVDVLRDNVEPALDILADAIRRPLFTEAEVEEAKTVMQLMIDEMPSDALSRDAAQMAAYSGSPLGHHHFCPSEKVDGLSADKLRAFHREFFVGPNCFLTAAGIEHDYFVSLAKDKFGDMPLAKNGQDRKAIQAMRKPSVYTGGLSTTKRNLKEPFVKIALSFEVGGWVNNDDFIAKCVLNQLLGGGSSFSAGGPGKGMYTRLYTQCLNQYSFMESMEAFMAFNEESGIMGIDAACPPEYLGHSVRIIVDQLVKLSVEPVTQEELDRARNMCKSMMLMSLESRVIVCEDIARQYVTYGHMKTPKDVCDQIDAVSAEDLLRVAQAMVQQAPSVGCVGHDLSKVPAYSDIVSFVKMYVDSANQQVAKHREAQAAMKGGRTDYVTKPQ